MKIIKIIVDENVPLIHLLNQQDWEVVPTQVDNVFAMTRKERNNNWSGTTLLKSEPVTIKPY